MICNTILDAMGNTPMIQLNRMVPKGAARVLVKYEGLNVGGSIKTRTNNAGGILGGITNGMPLVFQAAIKPTPSIALEQQTVDIAAQENATLCVKGRHDPAIVHRARIVMDAVTAIAVYDMLSGRFGIDYFAKD